MEDGLVKNPYEEGIDFAQLANDDPEFAKVLKPNSQLDFSKSSSVLQLTKSLLKRDFNLTIELPDDRLCPPVHNRLNYLLFIHTLLHTSCPISPHHSLSVAPGEASFAASKPSPTPPGAASVPITTSEAQTEIIDPATDAPLQPSLSISEPHPIIGLDIGTGASAIYPLLGCSSFPHYSFIATDIDAKSIIYARKNIYNNNLQDRIKLIESDVNVPLIPLGVPGVVPERLDFVMCNPPFYGSAEEMERGREGKDKPPATVCSGSKNEMICEGGEIQFITRIITESLVLGDRVQWYTSMVGKLASLVPLIERLKDEGCVNWAVSELVQGSKTRRWVLAWSWTGWRPEVGVARRVGSGTLEKKYLPFPSEYNMTLKEQDADTVGDKLDEALHVLRWVWAWDNEKRKGTGLSKGDVWSRAARRKLARRASTEPGEGEIAMNFGVRITVKATDEETEVMVRWLQGYDSVLFESFCGMVKRVVEAIPKTKRKLEDITS